MQTSIFLPLILIAGTGSDTAVVQEAAQDVTSVSAVLDGCRSPVLDTRESSKILYQNRLDALDDALRVGLPDVGDQPIFIARCGTEFVLFTRPAQTAEGDMLFLRFEEGSFELVGEVWG